MNQTNDLRFAFSSNATALLRAVCDQMSKVSHDLVIDDTNFSNDTWASFDIRGQELFTTITNHRDYQTRITSGWNGHIDEPFVRLIGIRANAITSRQLGWNRIGGEPRLRVGFDGVLHSCDETLTPVNHRATENRRVGPDGFVPWEPTVRITTTNARFTAVLRKVRTKGTFCIAANENAISIFSSGDEEPVRSFGANETYDSLTVAGVPYSTIYNTLYSRKSKHLGLINRLTNIGLSFDLTEYGIIKDRIYVTISAGTASATLLFEGITSSNINVPELPSTARQRRGASTEQMVNRVLEMDWNEAERERIHQWMLAHQRECDTKNKPYSDSIQRWFTDYTMMLIRSGDSPSELDLDIMSRI